VVQASGLTQGPYLVLLERTARLLPPALPEPPEHGQDHCKHTRLSLERRDAFRAAPFLCKGALGAVGRRPLLLGACRPLARVPPGRPSVRKALTGCRAGPLRRRQPRLEAALAVLAPGRGAPVPPRALQAGPAWGGTCWASGCIVWPQPRRRRERGQTPATAVRRPDAPAVVLVTGGWRPHLPRERRTARPLASLSLGAVARRRKTLHPSTPRPPPHSPPGVLPQRRQGAETGALPRDATASPLRARHRNASYAGGKRAVRSLMARVERPPGPTAYSSALS
jgi:hypothetical protein